MCIGKNGNVSCQHAGMYKPHLFMDKAVLVNMHWVGSFDANEQDDDLEDDFDEELEGDNTPVTCDWCDAPASFISGEINLCDNCTDQYMRTYNRD